MGEGGILETLVKLASLGTSGICIFAIFGSGWLLWKSIKTKDKEAQKTLRFYIGVCFLITLVSSATGFWAGRIDARQYDSLKRECDSLKEWKQAREQWYAVKGIVQKDDNKDPGDIVITTDYPPLSPDGNGKIIGLRIRRDYDGNLPRLGFCCPNYSAGGRDLIDQDSNNKVIEIGTVTLHRLP
jgi:hypothetical protein